MSVNFSQFTSQASPALSDNVVGYVATSVGGERRTTLAAALALFQTNSNLSGDVTSVGLATTIAANVIVNADVNSSAAIAYSKLNLGTSIVNADISASAAIVDTKLNTISTASKVSNSATTATNANTASAIVARDASGNFSAGTISAALTGNVTGNVSGSSGSTTGNASTATALATGRTIAITGDFAYTSPSFDGTGNVTAAGTLATVASAGTTGGSTAIPVVTINAKGLTTSITTAAVIAPAGTLSGNTLASGVTASSLTSLGTIANLAVTAGTISGTPSASTDIANKLYVDTVAQGLDAKASCVAATTADITLSGTQTIDGISVIAGNRVLVKNQTLSQNNGIYLCAAGAWTRTTDADTWDELTSAFTFIETGTVNADCGFVCTANAGGTLGTTALPWSQFSGAGSYTASTGLTLTGTAFSLTTPVAVANGGTGISSFGSGIATFLGTPTSANLAAALTDETGSGANVFGTSPTITTPVIAQINDASGNETLKLASIASAVNEVTIENAATGNAVHISATGGDASIGLHLVGKGASGYVNVQDSVDATKRIIFNAAGGTTNTRTMLSSTQTVDRTLSLPDATDTLVGRATTDTLTNKTLTSPTITGGALNGTLGATTPSSVAATTGTFSSTLGVTGVATFGNGAILGTPASGTVTNLTGTASININGTVGATTPSTVAATTIVGSGSAIFGNTSTPSTSVSGTQINNPLSVGPSIFSQGSAVGNRWIDFMGSSTTVCSFNNNSGVFSIAASSSGAEINVAGTQRGLFSSTGVAITGTLSATADVKAAVYGYFGSSGVAPSASNPGFAFSNPLNVSAASWSAGTATTSITLVNVYNGNGIVGSVVTNGSTTTWNITSDARLKTNLRDITNSSVIIDALKPRRFDWLTFTKEKDDYGFVAQEAYEVYPKMVTVGGDDPAEKPWGMDASKLIPVLVAELQSLRKRLAVLEAK